MKFILPILLLAFIHSSFAAKFSSPKGAETPWVEEAIWLNGLRLTAASSPNGAFKKSITARVDEFEQLFRAFPQLDKKITNVLELTQAGLSTGELVRYPWSYHSFPIQLGGLANRFADENFRRLKDWKDRYLYYQSQPAQALINRGRIKALSPLEKYEYLIGNKNFSLTQNEWREGLTLVKHFGKIPAHSSSCRGCAPAVIKHPKPHKAVSVTSHDGKQKITFSPADIKALLTYAWAKNSSESFMLGSRCELNAQHLPKNCYDINPGAFHLALTNLLGLHKKPLIIDTSPVISYELRYFNPKNRNDTKKIEEAIITRQEFTSDPFLAKRAQGHQKLVGVVATVTYVDKTVPSNEIDSALVQDRYASTQFTYDLELDDSGNILGGMWYEDKVPDFLWTVSERALPLSMEDRLVNRDEISYDGAAPIPSFMQDLAVASSARGQISFRVVDMLLRLSQ